MALFGSGKYKYELVQNWAKLPAAWSFIDVGGVAMDTQERLYVFNRSAHPLIILERNGDFVKSWGEGTFNRPHGIRITPEGIMYCTDDGSHVVNKYNLQGELLMTLGKKDKPSDTGYVKQADLQAAIATIKRGGPPFNRPTGIDLSSTGDLFISDGYGNARVHKFSPDGKYLFSWGEPGTGPGQFRLPHNVWVDKQDRVWVPDRENNRIQIFDAKGKFLAQWTNVARPTDVFIDDEQIVYVSELGSAAGGPGVNIFTIEGKLLTRFGNTVKSTETDLFIAPHAITVDSHGDVYVGEVAMTHSHVDRGARTVQKFARKR
jgi:DNA-binding beta-propeller fold protein YncE